jgi:hypothetical protein
VRCICGLVLLDVRFPCGVKRVFLELGRLLARTRKKEERHNDERESGEAMEAHGSLQEPRIIREGEPASTSARRSIEALGLAVLSRAE